jgi:proteic killer suppression protein
MIKSFRHKGLELFALKGDRSRLSQDHITKIKLILTRLHAAENPEQMNQPGYHFHELKGKLKGYYSVRVSGNWRIIFRFETTDVLDVDYVDYH